MSKEFICRECLYVGLPKKVKRGSTRMELIMWLVLMIPGPFYSVWRMTGKKKQCSVCGSDMLADPDTAIGRRLMDIADKQISGELKMQPGLMEKVRKPDAKIISAVAQQVDEAIRAETGMGLERGLGEKKEERKEVKELKQRPRGASGEQKPEDW